MSAGPSETTNISVPLEVIRQLGPLAAQQGITLPGLERAAPEIYVNQPIRNLALELGRMSSIRNLFIKAGKLVTVDPDTGEEKDMTATRFVGWIEEFCTIKGAKSHSLSRDDASLVLGQDIFLECIRPLDAIHLMRLPVMRTDPESLFKVEFLEKGYDAQSRIFTVEALKYDMTWTLDRAREFLREHNEEWPWAWPENTPEGTPVEHNRSYSVHNAAILGIYCRSMFPPGTTRPMITYIANQPGSGKSTMVAMAMIPVLGDAATSKTPKDPDKMAAELETVAQSMKPVLFLDDIGVGLFSNDLNRFITSDSHTGRIYNQNSQVFHVPNVTQVFATGNEIKTSQDLARRSLLVELFLAGDVQGRKFKKEITIKYLKRPEVRAGFLSACCAIVRNWIDNESFRHPSPLASFEDWTGIIGGMMMDAQFADPLAAPDLAAGGAEEADEMRELLIELATAADSNITYTRKEIIEKARECSLMEYLLGSKEDGEVDSNTSKKLGKQLSKWRGRELKDKRGRKFKFGHQRQKRGATYPLVFANPQTGTIDANVQAPPPASTVAETPTFDELKDS